jgi:hypothetical protein
MPGTREITKGTLLHLSVETFFAVLPLIVMSLVWSADAAGRPKSFWLGPDISMTSCVLYGLTLSKLLQGSVIASTRLGQNLREHVRETAAGYAALSLLPTFGIIFSVILIMRLLGPDTTLGWIVCQYMNFLLSILALIIIGGYGISRAEVGS